MPREYSRGVRPDFMSENGERRFRGGG